MSTTLPDVKRTGKERRENCERLKSNVEHEAIGINERKGLNSLKRIDK